MKEIIGSSVLILGYGVEGQDTHRYLHKFYPEVVVGIADQHNIKLPEDLPAQLFLGEDYLKAAENFETVVRSPGIPAILPILQKAKESGRNITSATNIFFSECPGTIIGITGTKGKSTTASLIAKILAQKYPDVRLVGNIGNPALDYLENANQNTLFVIELSSYQLEDIRYSPFVAVILDIVPEHLDRYQNFENYVAAKKKIVKFQTPKDYVVFNQNHKISTDIASQSLAKQVHFSLTDSLPVADTPLLGRGNRENLMAAIAVAKILKISYLAIRQAVKNFKPLPHRLEKIGEFRGITFYDDSISTIPQSTIHALEALGEKVETLIAGGFDRGLDYTELGKFLANRKGLKNIILFPDTGKKVWQAVQAAKTKQKMPLHLMKFDVFLMKQAVKIAFAKTGKGKICLLSPAAASYNLFKNFEDRGNEFERKVKGVFSCSGS